jgi:myo-inositol-1(or 4)-monophosphatase
MSTPSDIDRHDTADPADLLACAVEAARAAGGHALGNLHRRGEAVSRAAHDVKLKLDIECQHRAEAVIAAAYPAHRFMGEESAAERSSDSDDNNAASPYEWIVDPIDGTVNFSHGMPLWCCSVAVRRDRETLAGAVYAPAIGELYSATLDGPALCNGEPIVVSDINRLAAAMVTTGMDRLNEPGLAPFTFFNRIASHAQKARIMGSAALDLCFVARGRAEAYFEAEIFTWDVAAGGLIIRRAGGQTEILKACGQHKLRYLATNGHIHDELRALLTAPSSGNA